MTEQNLEVTEDQTNVDLSSHPDNLETTLADDAEVDALTKDLDPNAPILTGEEYV